MCIRSGILTLQPRNLEFQPVFATNWCFSVKLKANPFGFCDKNCFFKNSQNLNTGPLYVSDP
jgi:hypothetical protein